MFGGGGGGSIFEEFFGGGGGDGAREGADLRYDIEIALEEAARGVEKEISFRKLAACDHCNGTGAEPGSKRVTCPTCRGAGQVTTSRGFFTVRQVCPPATATAPASRNPAANAAARGGSTRPPS